MICSNCKKNTAIIFINDKDKSGKPIVNGLCFDCAKKKGFDPLEVLRKQQDLLHKYSDDGDSNANTGKIILPDKKDLNIKKDKKIMAETTNSKDNNSKKDLNNKDLNGKNLDGNHSNNQNINNNNINNNSDKDNNSNKNNNSDDINEENNINNDPYNIPGLSKSQVKEALDLLDDIFGSASSFKNSKNFGRPNNKDSNNSNSSKHNISDSDEDDGSASSRDKNIRQIRNRLDNLIKDISQNINFDSLNLINLDPEAMNKMAEDGENPFEELFNNMNNDDNDFDDTNSNSSNTKQKKKTKSNKKRRKFLDSFGTNLTQKAKNGEIDAVIGREKEITRMIEILNRRTKNNPCLIGEPGVGKTALAQGLALKIAQGNVPAKLQEKEVYLIDMTALVAGTQFRGQFESRMKSLIQECKDNGNIILVIDEIHNIIGAGDGDHSMNAANILKPSLANGEVQIIGTTTLKEYRKYIEKDSALERRFQPIIVAEPSIDDTIQILEGIKQYYEKFHSVKISKDIIEKTVKMSEKYIHDRFLPDKAIDILDEACSRINLNNKALYEIQSLEKQLKEVKLEEEDTAIAGANAETEEESNEQYEKAAKLKAKECKIQADLDKVKSTFKIPNVTVQDIARVIENWTKIPVTKITETESEKLLNLENNLHKRIIGQEEAVNMVARAIRRNRAGLKSTKRPPSFLFVGPTGVGKTELAKALAFEMFGNDEQIIRIDMSEYMESNSTAKLIGAPPGYVGYDDAGQLTEKVKRQPYSIILLDEIEKAHPDVFNILLQILDDGRLTDSQGNTISFENTIIIMTSNVGSNLNIHSIGFNSSKAQNKEKIESGLKETFRPEFLNRIDEIVIFDSLTTEDLMKIVDIMLKDTQKALDDKNIKLEVTQDAKQFLMEKGTNLKFGARPLRRAIQRYVEDEISEKILRNEIKNGDTIHISFENDKLKFE